MTWLTVRIPGHPWPCCSPGRAKGSENSLPCKLQVWWHPQIHNLEVLEKPHLSLSNSSFLPPHLLLSLQQNHLAQPFPSPRLPSSLLCWTGLSKLCLPSGAPFSTPAMRLRVMKEQLGPSAGCKLTLCWCELLFLDGIDNHTVISPLCTPPHMTDSCGLQYRASLFIFSQPYMCSPCCREAE